MKILGIETSCDETAAAVVENGTKILSNIVATSAEMHAKTGGVIPEQAARQQVLSIIPVINESLVASRQSPTTIDAIAVTVGPGLIGSLLVGTETARTLARLWKKPIVPVNHLVAHIYANWLSQPPTTQPAEATLQALLAGNHQPPTFPALALVVSGGHTDLVLMAGHGNLEWIGGTRDDAAGEAFDKCARLLGLPYPGGPSIAKTAMECQISNDKLQMFPRPMISENNFDWSFSGLKTAVLREVSHRPLTISHSRLAAEVQEAIVDVLVEKTLRAVNKFKPKSLLLAGGVAANQRLTEKFKFGIGHLAFDIDFRVPPPKLCTDNAAYIASYSFYNYSPSLWQEIDTRPELTIVGQV